MIKYTSQSNISSRIFATPFEKKLSPDNRWVQLEKLIPWDRMSRVFFDRMKKNVGRASVDLRIVMGTMFIQHSLNLTDRATIQIIQENIYMQYFVGLPTFQTQSVFDYSLLSIFRKRLGKDGAKELNDIFITHAIDQEQIKHRKERASSSNTIQNDKANREDHDDASKDGNQPEDAEPPKKATEDELAKEQKDPQAPMNKGTVKIDATVVPQDITYPTDTKLLNKSREISERIIDLLYKHNEELWDVKPRTYRRTARKTWLSFSKSRKSSNKKIRRQKKADLGYLRRNLGHIDEMMQLLLTQGIRIDINETLRKKLYVISEVYRQQKLMYDSK